MQEIVAVVVLVPGDPTAGDEQEAQQRPHVRKLGALVLAEAVLQPVDVDALDYFVLRQMRRAPQGENVDMVAPGGERLGVAGDAVIALVE